MQSEKISVIIPIYNVADYLQECLDSIIGQTYDNLEIICINDGSTDNSLEILENYQAKDERIIIVNQPNSGVSVARNNGLDVATGEYIMFCDPDDYYATNDAFDKAINAIKKAGSDICIFPFLCLSNGEIIQSQCYRDIKQTVSGIIKFNPLSCTSVVQKIYNHNFLKKYNIRFLENQQTAEDVIFTYMMMFHKAKISLLDEALYIYRINRENSLTTLNINGIKSDLNAVKTLYKMDIYKQQSEEMKKMMVRQFCGACFYFYEKFDSYFAHMHLRKDMKKMVKFFEQNHSKSFLLSLLGFCKLKKLIKFMPLQIFGVFFGKKKFSKEIELYSQEVNLKKAVKKVKQKLKNKKILVYGAGKFLEYIKDKFGISELNIVGISDMRFSENQLGEKYLGYDIVPRGELFNQEVDCILIAIQNYEKILFDMRQENTNKNIDIQSIATKPWWSIFTREP